MRIQRTVGAGIPSAVHVMLSDVLYSSSNILLILGATTDVKLNALLNGLLLVQKNKSSTVAETDNRIAYDVLMYGS